MHTINVIDPNTGQAHAIPYDELPNALKAGGQFADEEQKNKAIQIQDGTYQEDKSNPIEMTLTKGTAQDQGADWRGLASDTIRMFGRALKGVTGLALRAPGNIKEISSELVEHPTSYPTHVAQQVLAGLVGGTRDIANLPHKFFEELADRRITPNWLRTGSIPEDTGLEKFLGLEPTKKSDELLRVLPALYGGGQLVGKGITKAKQIASKPSKEKLFQRALEERVNKAAEKTSMSEADLTAFKDALKLDYSKIHGTKLGEPSPTSLQEGINVAEHALAEKKPLTEIPEQHVGEIPPEPDLKVIINEKKAALDAAKSEAEKAIGSLENPRLKGAEKVSKAIKDVHNSADALYKSARKHYVDKNISADNTAEIKSVTKDLESMRNADELAPGYGSGTAEQQALEAKLQSLQGEKVNASDIFDLQRTLEKIAEGTRKKQYSGVNDLEFKRLGTLADRLDANADILARRLESVGGKDVQKMIAEANKGWKIYKDLSLKNPVGKGALKGEIPMRSMIEIAKKHPGNDFLKALVDSDPELKRHILAAYTGESNANKLLKPTSLVKKYIEDLPEVEEHVTALKEALQGVKQGEVKASQVKKEYDDLVRSMKDAAKEQKVRQDAIKESEELKRQIQFKKDALPKIEAKLKEVDTHSAEHKRLKKELDEHKKFIQDKGGRLKELAKFFIKFKIAGKVPL